MKATTFFAVIIIALVTLSSSVFSQTTAASDNPNYTETIQPIVKKTNLEGKIIDGKFFVSSSFKGKLVTINPETRLTEKYIENMPAHTWVPLNGDGYVYRPGFLIIMTTEDGDDIRTDNMYFAKVSENMTQNAGK